MANLRYHRSPGGPRKVIALVVHPDHSAALVRLDMASNEQLYKLVGGWLEAVTPPGASWRAYCDEEGKLKGLPDNAKATALATAAGWCGHGDWLAGTVVFFGTGPDMDEHDVPLELLDIGATLGLWAPVAGYPPVEGT